MATRASTTPSLTAQAFWLLVAKTIGFGLTIVLPLVLVRTLSQTDFGVYKQAFLVVGSAVTILPLGFGMSAFYFLPRQHANHQAVVLHIFLVHLAVGALAGGLVALWPGVLVAIFHSTDLVPYAALLGAVILTWTVGSFLDIIAVARQDLAASTIFIVGSQAAKTLVFLAAARAGDRSVSCCRPRSSWAWRRSPSSRPTCNRRFPAAGRPSTGRCCGRRRPTRCRSGSRASC